MRNMDNSKQNKKQELAPSSHGDGKGSKNSNKKEKGILDNVVKVSTIAWTIVANIAIGVFLGQWVDNRFGTQPIFIVLFSILGIIASILFLFNLSKNLKK